MARSERRLVFLAILIFTVLTIVMTYPLPFSPGTSIRDYGDSLLNTWILATVGTKLFHLDFKNFFAGNIFYPETKPLLYSELLIPQAILAWPLFKITANPVFAHNLVLLLAIFTSGLGMFFLAFYLTRSFWPSIIAGTIFAFSPFMMAHTVQLQVVSAGGLPLLFLFLHRYFDQQRFVDWLCFGLVYVVQSLANIYYALFLVIFAGLFLLGGALLRKLYRHKRFWAQAAGFMVGAALCLGPLFWGYVHQQKKEGFERTIGAQAKVTSYLATARFNRVYGRFTSRWRQPEGELFPGFGTVLLSFWGMSLLFLKKREGHFLISPSEDPTGFIRAAASSSLSRKQISGEKPPLAGGFPFSRQIIGSYLVLMITAVSLCFGTKGTFWFLYRFIPGYRAIRAVPRFHIFTMFAMAVLAAYGLCFILRKIRVSFWRSFLTAACLGGIILEYLSVPLPTRPILGRYEMPEVYQELSRWPEKKVILELPLPEPGTGIGRVEGPRMYYSLFHGHTLVNGYSGFFSPTYTKIRVRLNRDSLEENIFYWQRLGVNLLIIHGDELRSRDFTGLIKTLSAFSSLRLVGQFGNDFLFRLL